MAKNMKVADSAQRAGPRTRATNPSWRQVMATTLSLWVSRRLPRVRRPRALLAVVCLLVVVGATLGVIRLTATSARGAQSSSPVRPHQVSAGPAGAAATVRSQVAVWIAGQVSSDAAIGCDPLMCAALRTQGVAAGRLLSLAPAASSTPGASVIAASPAGRAALSQNAPVLLASLGTGSSLVEVRATAPGGAASYQSALAADAAARRSAGAQLLHSGRIQASVQAAGQLRAGQVDSRLLIMLDLLAAQRSWRVIAFGDASPGVPLTSAPFRQVIVAAAGGGDGTAGLAPAIAVLRAQRAPYQAAQVSMVQLASGQPGLRIDFAVPGPLGLLDGSVSN